MRLVFMGTPDFSVPVLRALAARVAALDPSLATTAFLKEDRKDRTEILQQSASTIRQLVDLPAAATDLARRFEDAGVAAIIYTDIDRDGMLRGVNLEATLALARAVSLPLIASGGVASLDDLAALAAAYAFGLARNHPFIDGNKRVAFVAMVLFLRRNGISKQQIEAVGRGAAFEQGLDTEGPRVVAWAGGLASVTLAALVGLITHLRISSRAEVRRLGKDLARLAAVAERTSNAVILTDLRDRITWVNEGFCRMYGHAAADALGRQPQDLLGGGGEDADALRRLESARQQQIPCRVELVHRTRDGRQLWVELELQPMLDERGRVTGFMAIAADLTLQKETALQLASVVRENQGLLNTIRQHAIVSVADADGRIIDVNEAFCERSQYRRDELIGQSHRLMRSDHHPHHFWSAMWATIGAGKPWRGQICNRAKDGSLYWVDSIIAPFRGHDGQIARYVSIRTDITAAKRAEQALRESGQFLERVGRIAGVGGWSLDLQTEELVWSDQTCRLHGVPAGHRPTLEEALAFYTPEARPQVRAAVAQALADGTPWDLELELVGNPRPGGGHEEVGHVGEEQGGDEGEGEIVEVLPAPLHPEGDAHPEGDEVVAHVEERGTVGEPVGPAEEVLPRRDERPEPLEVEPGHGVVEAQGVGDADERAGHVEDGDHDGERQEGVGVDRGTGPGQRT